MRIVSKKDQRKKDEGKNMDSMWGEALKKLLKKAGLC